MEIRVTWAVAYTIWVNLKRIYLFNLDNAFQNDNMSKCSSGFFCMKLNVRKRFSSWVFEEVEWAQMNILYQTKITNISNAILHKKYDKASSQGVYRQI